MFLHVCVILLGSMHHRLHDQPLGGVCLHGGEVYPPGGLPPPSSAFGGLPPGVCIWVCIRGGGQTPLTRNRKVGSAHSTGMLSCYLKVQSEFSVQSTTKNFLTDQWRIQGGAPSAHPPTDQNFLNFTQFLGKFG